MLIVAGWVSIGTALALILGRRGHDRFSWFVLGSMLGPFAVVLAVDALRHEHEVPPVVVAAAVPAAGEPGGTDVLVGFDGSAEARAALETAIELFGGHLGRLTLTSIVPFGAAATREREAHDLLRAAAERFGWLRPELVVAYGEASDALLDASGDGGYDVLVVGTTGSGEAHLFGSTATKLARRSKVPVLLVGAGGRPT